MTKINIYYTLIVDGVETGERVAKNIPSLTDWDEMMRRVPGVGFEIKRIIKRIEETKGEEDGH